MKKILALAIAVLLILSMVACGDKEESPLEQESEVKNESYIQQAEGIYDYALNDNGACEIVEFTPASSQAFAAVLPAATPDGQIIVGVADGVFQEQNYMTSVTIPANYEYVGDYAFRKCEGLTEVIITNPGEKGLTKIGNYAFAECEALTTIKYTANNNVKQIGDKAFYGCSELKELNASTAEYIGDGAFVNCKAMTNLYVSDALTYIDATSFIGCTSLKYNQPEGSALKYIGESGADANKYVALITVGTPANNPLRECVVESGTTIVAKNAFVVCHQLTKVTLSDTVKHVTAESFNDCERLTFNEDTANGRNGNGLYLGTAANPYMVLIGTTSKTIKHVDVHAETKIITSTAFEGCNKLESVGFSDETLWESVVKEDGWNQAKELTMIFGAAV